MSELGKISLILCIGVALAACGQTGRLYLPSTSGEVTTRSTQTPAEPGGGNSAQTGEPAPEGDAASKDDKGKKTPSPEPQKN